MYLHLGRDVAVSVRDIVGVFDLDTTSYSKRTREFLSRSEKADRLVNISDDIPKSFVLCAKRRKPGGFSKKSHSKKKKKSEIVFLAQISSATL